MHGGKDEMSGEMKQRIIQDTAVKSAGVALGFADRISGSLIITGTVSEVEAATQAIVDYVDEKLGFTICRITRT